MSLITQDNKIDLVTITAKRLLQMPSSQFQSVLGGWKMGMRLIWDDENPQAILDAIGVHGKELFELSTKTAIFLESVEAGCTKEYMKKVLPCTINSDGSITINNKL